MPGSGAFEWSTPAEAQTKPWRVSAMMNGGRARTIRAVSRRTTSTSRGSRVAGELARPLRRLDVLDPHDAALGLRDRLLRDDDDVAVLELRARPAISAPRSSPASISGRPSTGTIEITGGR